MTDTLNIHGHDIIDLISSFPEGIPLKQLTEIITEQYGNSVVFHTCSAEGMDLDALLVFLEAHEKIQLKNDLAYPGSSPACDH